ncbi:MAG: hypothetical protein HFI33_03740 [Lachnospiraceae bacterium]|nr:hypothetical protein [Lachnospiraceae bacterium]
MDKYEFKIKAEQIQKLIQRKDYRMAAKIADGIEWKRVKNVELLMQISEVYERLKRYEDSYEILNMAYDRAPIGRMIVYKMAEMATLMGEVEEATELYKEFVKIAPHDLSRYILKYKLYQAKSAPTEDLIAILQEFKSREYHEKWAYELAALYYKEGMLDKCVEECDDLILWFSEGEYVRKAMELKLKIQPLTASQEQKYREFAHTDEELVQFDELVDQMEDSQPEESFSEEPEIEIFTIDPEERYNTVNLQAEVAAGVRGYIDEEVHTDQTYAGDGYGDESYGGESYTEDGDEEYAYGETAYENSGYTENGYENDEYEAGGYGYGGYVEGDYEIDAYGEPGYESDDYEASGYENEGYVASDYGNDVYEEPGYESDDYEASGYENEGYEAADYEKDTYIEPGYESGGYDEAAYGEEAYGEAIYGDDGYSEGDYETDIYGSEEYRAENYESGNYEIEDYESGNYEIEDYESENYEIGDYETDAYNSGSTETQGDSDDSYEDETYKKESLVPDYGAEEAKRTEEIRPESSARAGDSKPRKLYLGQAEDGQLTFDDEENVLDRQITGQIRIEDILAEWEAKKQKMGVELNRMAREEQERKEKALRRKLEAADFQSGLIPMDVQQILDEIEGKLPVKIIVEPIERQQPGFLQEETDSEETGYEEETDHGGEAGSQEEYEEYQEYEEYDQEQGIDTGDYSYEDDEEDTWMDTQDTEEYGLFKEGEDPDYSEDDSYLEEPEEEFYGDYQENSQYEEASYKEDVEYLEETEDIGDDEYEEFPDYPGDGEYEDDSQYQEDPENEEDPDYLEDDEYLEDGKYEEDLGYLEDSENEEDLTYLEDPEYLEDGKYEEDPGYEENMDENQQDYPQEDEIEEILKVALHEEMESGGDLFAEENISSGGSKEDTDQEEEKEATKKEKAEKESKKGKQDTRRKENQETPSGKKRKASEMMWDLEKVLEDELKQVSGKRLSEEQEKLFAYFTSVHGMNQQLSQFLEDEENRQLDGTSVAGNIVVTGESGSGKTTLAVDLVKAIQKLRGVKGSKMARVTGDSMNQRDVAAVVRKMNGGALVIERAGGMTAEAAAKLSGAMLRQTGNLFVVLEDEPNEVKKLFTRCESLAAKFERTIEIPVFTNHELVAFGKSYGQEQGYVLDEMAVLALYNRIGNNQTSDHLVNVSEVKDMIDDAIISSSRRGIKRLFSKRRQDEFGNYVLMEKDFEL